MAAGRRAALTYYSPTWLARPPVATHQTHAVRATQGPTLPPATCDKTATPSVRAGIVSQIVAQHHVVSVFCVESCISQARGGA